MVKKPKAWSLYILRCADGTLYTGISNRLEVRVRNHSLGKGARYTRTRLPIELVFTRKAGTYSQALKKERQMKRRTRKAKLQLVEAWLRGQARKKAQVRLPKRKISNSKAKRSVAKA
ncbi:MAG: GIY-YIG nuclease family protein [bacterium]